MDRLEREKLTIKNMVRLYCREKHDSPEGLCQECSELQEYALQRLERCPWGAGKPTCANCPVHCYRGDKREQVRGVMRFAGPRMLLKHPWLAVMHLLDGLKKPPKKG
jgi:hypothetical protein